MSEGDELRICEPATPLEAGPHHFGYSPTSPKSPADCGFEDGLLVDSSRTSPRGEGVTETEPVALKRTSSVTLTENRRVHLFDKRAPAMHHLSLDERDASWLLQSASFSVSSPTITEPDNFDDFSSPGSKVEILATKLRAFYEKYAPEKVDKVPKLAEKYAQRQRELNNGLWENYGADLEYLDDLASEASRIHSLLQSFYERHDPAALADAGFLARMVRDYEANEDAFNEALQAQYALKTTELPWA